MRQLTEEEKHLCQKNLQRLKEDKARLLYYQQYYDLMISHGLKINYEEKMKEFLAKKRDINADLQAMDFEIIEINRQINEGVQEK